MEKLGHAFGAVEVIKAPTCTETGISGKRCTHEGCEVIDSETVLAATGHTWDEGMVTTEPTYETDGIKTFTCSVCKATKTEQIPALAPTVVASGTCGHPDNIGGENSVTWALSEDGVLTISGTGAMDNYILETDTPWYKYNNKIKSIVIENGVTSVGNYAFRFCTTATAVTIANSVEKIGDYAFENDYNIVGLTLSNKLTSVGTHAFSSCSKIESLDLPETLTTTGHYAFSGCKALTSLTIPGSLKTIDGYAFAGCSGLTEVTISDGVKSIQAGAFQNCTALASVHIPYGLTSVGKSAFSGCTSLKNIYYGGTWENWRKVSIDSENDPLKAAFCHPTDEFECGDNLMWSLSEEGVLTISGTGAMDDFAFERDVPWYRFKDKVKSIVIEDGVTSVGNNAFPYCINATAVMMANSVEKIGDYAFKNGYNIVDLTLSNKLTSVGKEAFSSCSKITSLDLPETLTTTGHYAFSGCKALTSLTIPGSLKTIDGYAFAGCSGLTEVTISDGVKSIQAGAFQNCTALASVHIPYGLTSVGKSAFSGCTSLKNIYYGGTWENWRKVSIDSENDPLKAAFCHPTDEFECGDNLMWSLSEEGVLTISGTGAMDDYTNETETPWYKYNNKIKTVILKTGVTSIGSKAFSTCSNLTNIDIPLSVTTIGDSSFSYCTALENVFYAGCSESVWEKIAIESNNKPLLNAARQYSAHTWGEGMVTTEPTCTEDGVKTYTCSVCNETKTETITATGHQWDEGVVTSEPTYTENGEKTFTCVICRTTRTEPIPMLTPEPDSVDLNEIAKDFDGSSIGVDVDGKTVYPDGEGNYPRLTVPEGTTTLISVSTCNLPEGVDPHTRYPVSMAVYKATNTDGTTSVERISEMDDLLRYAGSSIRITGNKGIRLITGINASLKSALTSEGVAGYTLEEYGTLLCWASEVQNGSLSLSDAYARHNYAYSLANGTDPVFRYAGDVVQYTNVLVGFSNEQCVDDIAMRPYITLRDADGNTYTLYGGIVNRSIGYIAYQNRGAFTPGTNAYNYIWDIIHFVYGDVYDEDYKG